MILRTSLPMWRFEPVAVDELAETDHDLTDPAPDPGPEPDRPERKPDPNVIEIDWSKLKK